MQLNVKAVIFEPMTDTRYDIVYRLKENGIVMLQLFSSVYPELTRSNLTMNWVLTQR